MIRIMAMSEVNGRLHAGGLPLIGEIDRASVKAHPEGRHLPKALMRVHRDDGALQFVKRLFSDVGVRSNATRQRLETRGTQTLSESPLPDRSVYLPPDGGTLIEQRVRSHDGRRSLRVSRLTDGMNCMEVTPAFHPSHGPSMRFTGGRIGTPNLRGVTVTLSKTSLLAVIAVLIGERHGYDGADDVDGAPNTLSVMRHADGCVDARLIPRGGHVVSLRWPKPDVTVVADRLIERLRCRYPDDWEKSVYTLVRHLLPAQIPGDDHTI